MYVKLFIFIVIYLITRNAFPKEYVDELSRKIELSNTPARIISLTPNITEIIYFLKAEDRLIGVTNFCNYPPEVSTKEKIGNYINPNLEKIIKLKVDLIIGTAEGFTPELGKKIDKLNIPFYVTYPKKIKDIPIMIKKIGELIGADPKVLKFTQDMNFIIEKLHAEAKSLRNLKILYLIEDEPIISPGKDTFIDDMLEMANFQNIGRKSFGRYPKLNLEFIIKENPEGILVGTFKQDKTVTKLHGFKSLKAVKNNRIYKVDPDIFSRPGPRIVEALGELVKIHRELIK